MAKNASDQDIIDLSFPRGDNKTVELTLTDSDSNAIDLSGLTVILTVNSDDEPSDITDQVFQLTGTVTDGPNGVVQFKPTTTQAVQSPETYFYDIQVTLADGTRLTPVIGKWKYTIDYSQAGVTP